MEATLTEIFKAGLLITKTYILQEWKELPHANILVEGLDLQYNTETGICAVYGITLHDQRTEEPIFNYNLDMDDNCLYDVSLDKKILKRMLKIPIEILQEIADYPEMYDV